MAPASATRSRLFDDGRNSLPVEIVENRRARRMTLRIVPGGTSLRLTVPPNLADRQIDSFIERQRNWIAARLARMPQPLEIVEGAVIPFLGVGHRIVHVDRLRGVVEPLVVSGEPVLQVPGERSGLSRRVHRFLISEARERLNMSVGRFAQMLDVSPRAVRITDTKSRWGSCSTTRTLSFSWRIVMAPGPVLDYLAAHETAHLVEMNHGPQFWALVAKICPDMEVHKAWLRTNGPALHAVRVD